MQIAYHGVDAFLMQATLAPLDNLMSRKLKLRNHLFKQATDWRVWLDDPIISHHGNDKWT